MADASSDGARTAQAAISGAQALVRALEAEGVEYVFGYPGGAIMPVYDALVGSSLKHILVRHEQGAALAADGYARASGKVGVCMATSGPGATNLVTGIAIRYCHEFDRIAHLSKQCRRAATIIIAIIRMCTDHNDADLFIILLCCCKKR